MVQSTHDTTLSVSAKNGDDDLVDEVEEQTGTNQSDDKARLLQRRLLKLQLCSGDMVDCSNNTDTTLRASWAVAFDVLMESPVVPPPASYVARELGSARLMVTVLPLARLGLVGPGHGNIDPRNAEASIVSCASPFRWRATLEATTHFLNSKLRSTIGAKAVVSALDAAGQWQLALAVACRSAQAHPSASPALERLALNIISQQNITSVGRLEGKTKAFFAAIPSARPSLEQQHDVGVADVARRMVEASRQVHWEEALRELRSDVAARVTPNVYQTLLRGILTREGKLK
eukprot:PhM_4_TR14088/c0_g1_i1/m.106950